MTNEVFQQAEQTIHRNDRLMYTLPDGSVVPSRPMDDPHHTDHTEHARSSGSCLDNPMHNSDDFCSEPQEVAHTFAKGPVRGTETVISQEPDYPSSGPEESCCRCGGDVRVPDQEMADHAADPNNTPDPNPYFCNQCGCVYHCSCVTDQEKHDHG